MKIAVFSDVHGNLIALNKFLDVTTDIVDAYLCFGDIVNYGPWNDECLDLILNLPEITVLEGNHERLFLNTGTIEHESSLVQDFYNHSKGLFSRVDLITGLPQYYQLGSFRCQHTIRDLSIYPDTSIQIDSNCMVGHSHYQFQIERSGFKLVNPGSVGQNRKWINMVDYLIFDTKNEGIQLFSEPYDFDLFLSELRQRNYPEHCIAYYSNKPRIGV